MPLTFSENKETQQVGVFENLKENIRPDSYIKTYDSCASAEEISPASDTKYEKLDCFNAEDNTSGKEDVSLDLEIDIDRKQRHVYISEDIEEDSIVETTALKQASEPSNSTLDTSIMNDNYLTMSGTIKRGKKKGQNVEVVLNMSREELEILEANMTKKNGCHCNAGTGIGFHVVLWSIICLPFSVVISAVYSFCMGTITWYNVFTLFSERKALGYRVLVPPFLIILYPFLIISVSLGLGIYAGIKQVSCYWDSWLKEFTDYEKGFYGWLCNSMDVPECSPYEVVILSGVQKT